MYTLAADPLNLHSMVKKRLFLLLVMAFLLGAFWFPVRRVSAQSNCYEWPGSGLISPWDGLTYYYYVSGINHVANDSGTNGTYTENYIQMYVIAPGDTTITGASVTFTHGGADVRDVHVRGWTGSGWYAGSQTYDSRDLQAFGESAGTYTTSHGASGATVRTLAIDVSIYNYSSNANSLVLDGFEVCTTTSVFATITPTFTPTVTSTITPTPTGTLAAGGLFPTYDIRPPCTPTLSGSITATRRSLFDIPTSTSGPSWTPIPSVTGAPMATHTATPSLTPTSIYGSPSPTSTPTLARTPGDCSAGFSFSSGEGQGVDVSITDYVRDGDGNVIENCYGVFPGFTIGLDSTTRNIINTLAGSEVVTVDNSTVSIDDVSICVKYRVFTLVILRVDFMPFAGIVLGFGLIMFMLQTFRREL